MLPSTIVEEIVISGPWLKILGVLADPVKTLISTGAIGFSLSTADTATISESS